MRRTLSDLKPLRIGFDKIDGLIRLYERNRYLVLFDPEKYYAICNSIRYIINLESGITYVFFHNYARIKVN